MLNRHRLCRSHLGCFFSTTWQSAIAWGSSGELHFPRWPHKAPLLCFTSPPGWFWVSPEPKNMKKPAQGMKSSVPLLLVSPAMSLPTRQSELSELAQEEHSLLRVFNYGSNVKCPFQILGNYRTQKLEDLNC
uniref:Uncharacterized protein n=1 Tax=Micrurus lemniscatus lemniscatus TaxID=129467 RepID=A0A2D4IH30_MICLE